MADFKPTTGGKPMSNCRKAHTVWAHLENRISSYKVQENDIVISIFFESYIFVFVSDAFRIIRQYMYIRVKFAYESSRFEYFNWPKNIIMPSLRLQVP